MTDMTQAPTPGPLSGEQKAVEAMQGAITWDKERGYRMPYRVRDPLYAAIDTLTSLAPTAPVEASGSERDEVASWRSELEIHAKYVAARADRWRRSSEPGAHYWTEQDDAEVAKTKARLAILAALRPQPSGETRWVRGAWTYVDQTGRRFVPPVSLDTSAPAPVASGGQHSSGEVACKTCMDTVGGCDTCGGHIPSVNAVPAQDDDKLRQAASALLDACVKDFGDPAEFEGDDGSVACSKSGGCAVTFKHMRDLNLALKSTAAQEGGAL